MNPENNNWWGTFQLAAGSAGCWRIGPTTLFVERLPQEWRIANDVGEDAGDDALDIEIPAAFPELIAHDSVRRFGVSDTSDDIALAVKLADRPVVATPEKPVEIPAGGEITVYIGSPVWVLVEVGEPRRTLLEMPLQRPPDTWFGPSARVGELCYASRTHCRLRLDEVVRRPHRALTSVLVRNRATTPLVLDQVKLPVLHLAIYRVGAGWLWTQDVVLEHEHERALSPLEVRKGPPRQAEAAELVSPPRVPLSDNPMVRAFSSLFSA